MKKFISILFIFWFGFYVFEKQNPSPIYWNTGGNPTGTYYEVRMDKLHQKTGAVMTSYYLGYSTLSWTSLIKPSTGYFRVKVRACLDKPCIEGNADRTTDWSYTTNYQDALVNGSPQSWVIYYKGGSSKSLLNLLYGPEEEA